MIQPLYERVDDGLDLAVIYEISLCWIDFPFHPNFKSERVSVESVALVVGRKGRQIVRGLEVK